jgi:hypothetical protein
MAEEGKDGQLSGSVLQGRCVTSQNEVFKCDLMGVMKIENQICVRVDVLALSFCDF